MIGVGQTVESLHGQTCAHEKNQSERHLSGDESVAQASSRGTGRTASGFFEHGIQTDVPQVKRGQKAKDKSEEQREKNREKENRGIDTNAIPAGNPLGPIRRNAVAKHAHTRKRCGNCNDSAEKGEQRQLGEQQAAQPGAVCTQRRAHGKFPLARNHPRKEEICEVGAGQKEHKHGGRLQQREQRQSVKIEFFSKRQHIEDASCVGLGIEFRKPA